MPTPRLGKGLKRSRFELRNWQKYETPNVPACEEWPRKRPNPVVLQAFYMLAERHTCPMLLVPPSHERMSRKCLATCSIGM